MNVSVMLGHRSGDREVLRVIESAGDIHEMEKEPIALWKCFHEHPGPVISDVERALAPDDIRAAVANSHIEIVEECEESA